MKTRTLLGGLLTTAVLATCGLACNKKKSNSEAEQVRNVTYEQVTRADFNRLAQHLNIPLFWASDTESPLVITPKEVVVVLGPDKSQRADWVDAKGNWTDRFKKSYDEMAELSRKGPSEKGLKPSEVLRRSLVRQELDQGRPTLLRADLSKLSEPERNFASQMMEAGRLINELYAKQTGAAEWEGRVLPDDPASKYLFFRNQGPWCRAPETEENPKCSAVPETPKQVFGLYPAPLQEDSGFCDYLDKQPNGDDLMGHFNTVSAAAQEAAAPAGTPAPAAKDGAGDAAAGVGPLLPTPYAAAYASEMAEVANLLEASALTLQPDASEAAMVAYLKAAASAFRNNTWFDADEPWSEMNGKNSKWYLRIGPDEVYFEPCNRKAGFHMTFAKINPDSLEWQKKLEPVKQGMEKEIARLAGPPYRERQVSFHLPDFIDIVLNAGDSRKPFGGTIGQSLPNWGPVAAASKGRTVVMTNLYDDEDSRTSLKDKASSLLCEDTMKLFTTESGPMVMSIVLHEAGHNLGPSHDYAVKGKTGPEIFTGPIASMLEELKAQTIALYFTDWLTEQKVITPDFAQQTHVRDLVWAFGHISRGMYTPKGKPRAYSQLAAIQFGSLMNAGAVTWREEKAANGTDMGCFSADMAKFGPAVAELMTKVAKIKGSGNKPGVLKLIADYVDVTDEAKTRHETIRERWLRGPKASFVYSVELN
jgi:hypothetical protein